MVLLKASIILYVMDILTNRKKYIVPHKEGRQPFNTQDFLITYSIETITYLTALQLTTNNTTILNDFLLFIPESFLYELIFDFFHYWMHRMMHMPFFYARIHKKHHEYVFINSNTTFDHSVTDLLLTNFLPIICASYIVRVSPFTLTMIFWFKTIIEVSGHTGKETSSSFIQCIYLPKFLSIPLYSKDHLLHHMQPTVNFSKRFSIWDKIFGTYKNFALTV